MDDGVCVTSKPEDCYLCLQFTSEQKLKLRKVQKKIKECSVSKEVEDSLLGVDENTSTSATSTTVTTTPSSASTASASDPLQSILSKLEVMQGCIATLENASCNSTSSNEVNLVEGTRPEEEVEQDRFQDRHSCCVFC